MNFLFPVLRSDLQVFMPMHLFLFFLSISLYEIPVLLSMGVLPHSLFIVENGAVSEEF